MACWRFVYLGASRINPQAELVVVASLQFHCEVHYDDITVLGVFL